MILREKEKIIDITKLNIAQMEPLASLLEQQQQLCDASAPFLTKKKGKSLTCRSSNRVSGLKMG